MAHPSWKTLRESPPEPETLLEICGVTAAPVDVKGLATQLGVEIAFRSPAELAQIVPWEIKKLRLPAFDELLIDGVASIDDQRATILLSNDRKIAPTRQRFTIATLLCHTLLHPPGFYVRLDDSQRLPEEEEALDFASELLIPLSLLDKEFKKSPNATWEDFAKTFNVSTPALKVRLERLNEPALAVEPWLALGLPPETSLDDAQKIVDELLKQHRPELFESLPPKYGEEAARTRQALEYNLARLRLQVALNLPHGIPHYSSMPTVVEVGAVLKEARDLIVKRGWCQKFRARDGYGKKQVRFDREDAGQFNPVGAIYRAAGEDRATRDIALAAFAYAVGVGDHPSEIDNWNDKPDRTREHVVNGFNKAISTTERTG